MKKSIALLLALVLVFALAACGSNSSNSGSSSGSNSGSSSGSTSAAVETEQASAPGEAGFDEIPIFEDEEVGGDPSGEPFMNVSAVYFQPVPMAPNQMNYQDYDLHLECDISALENDLGYEVGSWIPYLTIDYRVIDANGNDAAAGTMMHMAASDGPHYGANIKLPNAGTYSLEFTIHSPADMDYLVHADSDTGPGGLLDDARYWGNGNIVILKEAVWEYEPVNWF